MLKASSFRLDSDLPRLTDFLVKARAVVGHCGFYHLGDLSWNLYLAELRGWSPERLRIWESPEGEIVGFAMLYPPDAIDLQTAPWTPDRNLLEIEMLEWGEARLREAGDKASRGRMSVEVFEEDDRLISFLASKGFKREQDHKLHMHWDLRLPVPKAVLPEGYEVRELEDRDLPARGELQRSVWPWSRVGEESYGRLRSMPGFHRELDLVGVAPSGELACFALCWYDAFNRVGEFEPVGTRPEYRGKGLGKATMLEGLRRLQSIGADSALVYPPGDELPAQRLYESAGFRLLQRQYVYSREL